MNRTTVIRSIRTAAVAAAVGVGLLASAGSASAAGWEYFDLNANGRSDTAAYDVNADGNYEHVYHDGDENGAWDLSLYTTGNWMQLRAFTNGAIIWQYRDAAANWLYIDGRGDGRYETLGYDQDRNGSPEWVVVDNNGDGSYDGNWVSTARPATATTTWTPYGTAVKAALDIWMSSVNASLVDIWL